MTRPRVCLIYTGGTIGMVRENKIDRPPENPDDFLALAPELQEFVDVDFVILLNKDSTNMNPYDWELMARAVYDRRNEGYSGFVIAHGTDTMHFSSSAVSFALGQNLAFPVVFTGAQAIPEIAHGDARVNLIRACKVALTDLAEVAICFGDYVFRGCRVQKKDEKRFDAFESPGFFPIGYITEEIELLPTAKIRTDRDKGQDINYQGVFETGILEVALIPGLPPALIQDAVASEECKGLMLQSFGAGNVPDEDPYSFEEVIRYTVQEMKKPVLIVSQFPAHATLGSSYKPGVAALKAGAIPTGNMTNAAAVAKFGWLLAQVNREIAEGNLGEHRRIAEIKTRMSINYVGEMDHPTPRPGSR